MRTFTCPDGLVIVLDKVTHIEHPKQDGYKEDSPWRFTVHFTGGGHTEFPLDHENRFYGMLEGKIGYSNYMLPAVERVRTELIAALSGLPASWPTLTTSGHFCISSKDAPCNICGRRGATDPSAPGPQAPPTPGPAAGG